MGRLCRASSRVVFVARTRDSCREVRPQESYQRCSWTSDTASFRVERNNGGSGMKFFVTLPSLPGKYFETEAPDRIAAIPAALLLTVWTEQEWECAGQRAEELF